MSTNNRGIGQLNLSLLETSAEGLKLSRRNIEDFLSNLKVVAESLKIRSNQSYENDMDIENVHKLNLSSQYDVNEETIIGIESLNLYDKDNNFDDNKNITPKKCSHKNDCDDIYDVQSLSKNVGSPKPPVSPRSIKESKIISEINVFLKSPRKKEDEFDEATVVKQFSRFQSYPTNDSEDNIKNVSSKTSLSQSNMSFEEDIDNNTIPSFYFPNGEPSQFVDKIKILNAIEKVFKKFPEKIIQAKDFDQVCTAIEKPTTWSRILINGCLGKTTSDTDVVSYEKFKKYWLEIISECFDDVSIFIRLLVDGTASDSNNTTKRKYLITEDFKPLIYHVINSIRDLEVLKNAPTFHSAYVNTVITRIFWRVCRSWLNKITPEELRKSNFLDIYGKLDKIDNINDERYFFSYIHFYVIYCKFWELDEDRDLMITPQDLKKYSDEALPSRVIDRIFQINQYSKKYSKNLKVHEFLDYPDFTLFLLADENKRHNKALEYWFRILDIDGDGRLSFEELEYFHEEIIKNVKCRVADCKSMSDTLCHVFDMISPANDHYITLNDIKRSKIEQEITDGESPQSSDDTEIDVTEWDNFCNKQYELITEDVDDSFNCADDDDNYNFLEIDSDNSTNGD